ncbi:iron ABC transporter permease [Acidipropionibacterium acidipropionici]|uniref:Iron ABC transporter permease n=2 Tax=Acidipropionibacterium acidipropionici TaxID=1748 RepID=A0AAC9AND6_9ACTN|nr:iron ABC transporter permease [Acidipropionibacterium acidipropionici]AFV90547.1 Transport system permease protein [Acidipropionibacterium acidipropionici ATCC 4875]AMS05246.1 iron ABC transporter permease [Acidipropionibacterium acidipropionici]AOZ46726.1 iron ABC transporter permease [Acidipropionibacterium acidipropionici]AZP37204.1 iron ABC transporter permease [Acidipropionibacterium acidipropionici]
MTGSAPAVGVADRPGTADAVTDVATAPGPSTAPRGVRRWGLALALIALLAACAASVGIGSRTVPPAQIWQALTDPSVSTIAAEAVRSRVPRTVLGLLVGASLAVSGALMQGITRNPLADPGILGVNAGAAAFVVIGMAYIGLNSAGQYIWLAVAGAALAAAAVWAVGSGGRGRPSPLRLALAGAVMAAVLTSITQAVLLPRAEMLQSFRTWQAGGIEGARFDQMTGVLPFFLVGAVLAVFSGRALNSLALGDEMASGLGLSVGRTRLLVACAAVLLAAASTALAGPIGFVGLIVPHAVRAVVGADNRWVLAWSVVVGPLLLLVADVVGRVVTRPTDIQVGIVMAIIGAPVFIVLVRNRKFAEL